MEQIPDEGIMIGKDHRLTSDKDNIILSLKRTSKNTDKVYWQNTNYFGTIKNALSFFVEHQIRATGLSTLKAIDEKIDELHKVIRDIEIPTQTIEAAKPTKTSSDAPQSLHKHFRRKKVVSLKPKGK